MTERIRVEPEAGVIFAIDVDEAERLADRSEVDDVGTVRTHAFALADELDCVLIEDVGCCAA